MDAFGNRTNSLQKTTGNAALPEKLTACGLADWADTLAGDGPDPDLRHMGPAQKLVLLGDLMDALTQRLADQFDMDAKNMALVVGDTHRRWVSSIGTAVILR